MEIDRKEFARVMKAVEGIESKVIGSELYTLYSEAKKAASRGVILEIGSWVGRSTVTLGLACKAVGKGRVYAIDPHVGSVAHKKRKIKSTLKILKENLIKAGVYKYVKVISKTSVEVNLEWPKNRKINLLWIDGKHVYVDVKEDFLLWSRYVTPGGIIILHDVIGFEGPRRLMLSYILKSREFVCTSLVGEMATLKKKRKMKMRNLLSKDYFNFLSLLRNAMYFLVLSVFYKFDTPKSYK